MPPYRPYRDGVLGLALVVSWTWPRERVVSFLCVKVFLRGGFDPCSLELDPWKFLLMGRVGASHWRLLSYVSVDRGEYVVRLSANLYVDGLDKLFVRDLPTDFCPRLLRHFVDWLLCIGTVNGAFNHEGTSTYGLLRIEDRVRDGLTRLMATTAK